MKRGLFNFSLILIIFLSGCSDDKPDAIIDANNYILVNTTNYVAFAKNLKRAEVSEITKSGQSIPVINIDYAEDGSITHYVTYSANDSEQISSVLNQTEQGWTATRYDRFGAVENEAYYQTNHKGQIIKVSFSRGDDCHFNYDDNNQLLSKFCQNPTLISSATYHRNGRISSLVHQADPEQSPDSADIIYDRQNRPIKITYQLYMNQVLLTVVTQPTEIDSLGNWIKYNETKVANFSNDDKLLSSTLPAAPTHQYIAKLTYWQQIN